MPSQWLSNSSAVSPRVVALLTGVLAAVSRPSSLRRLRQCLIVLFVLWAVLALSRLLWALLPVAEPVAAPATGIINPLSSGDAGGGARSVDIDRIVGWHLFGKPGAAGPVTIEPEPVVQDNARAGIEKGAKETRLNLKLRGIVASTADGLGHAVIEASNQQDVYAVGDKLPVAGNVQLAKVMPHQVVIDNGGTYELLVLFEEPPIGQAAAAGSAPLAKPGAAARVEKRSDQAATELARSYRERLYKDPQSLADVVNVSAVRDGDTLVGYRLKPGKDREQFTQLGFKEGDLVMAVNGVSLDSPANTMILYNSMRTAQEAVFELQREGQQLTLNVNLDSGATD